MCAVEGTPNMNNEMSFLCWRSKKFFFSDYFLKCVPLTLFQGDFKKNCWNLQDTVTIRSVLLKFMTNGWKM